MTRGLGLIGAVISLAIAGVLFTMQGKSQGPSSVAARAAETQAMATASKAIFSPVDQILQVDQAQTGTYAGAQIPLGSGVALEGATTVSYCLQASVTGTMFHESGPGGSPTPGPC